MSVKDPNSPRTHSGTNPSSSVSFIHSEREREQWPRCSWNRGSPLKHQRLQATASNKTLNTRNSGLVEHNTNSEWKTVDLLGKPEREQKRLFSKWYSETSCDADQFTSFWLMTETQRKSKHHRHLSSFKWLKSGSMGRVQDPLHFPWRKWMGLIGQCTYINASQGNTNYH